MLRENDIQNFFHKILRAISRKTASILGLFLCKCHAESKYGNEDLNFDFFVRKLENFNLSPALHICVERVNCGHWRYLANGELIGQFDHVDMFLPVWAYCRWH